MDCDFSHRFEDLDRVLKDKDFFDLTIAVDILAEGTEGWSYSRKNL